MHVTYTPAAIFLLLSLVLCLFTASLLLLFAPRAPNKVNFLLGAYFLAFSWTLWVVFLIFTNHILSFPHFYRTGNISWLVALPLAYLYIRVAVKHVILSWRDLIHLIPLVFFLIDFSPFLLLSAATKYDLIMADIQNLAVSNSFRQGWLLPANGQVVFRVLVMCFYGYLQIRLLVQLPRKERAQQQHWYNWLVTLTVLQLLPIPIVIFSMLTSVAYVWCTCIPPAAAALLACMTLFLRPRILYGFSQPKEPVPVKMRWVAGDVVGSESKRILEALMQDSKPYLNSDYKLAQLADDLHMTIHQASAFLNQVAGHSFHDYINLQRINYSIELIKGGKMANLNMKGISERCGFNNRNSFTSAFKKFKGITPSEYVASLR
ncbi:AraC family transcriptional regulator [Paraflavitalea sp. CAU 1676]|uniref:helix-turn-helix transcriptional regulator n=1 Tax=Paraflavitalea sp. CAU 1676 TaxID=3032598 RepID=UPI0023D9ADBD|nr:AraC family transcriptional regulator [Paraflavitalea sp. CAU 1676]MDF2190603.1 AraC family transcriptional regulator [Paraflavitalea sp. CAU 1676]